MSKFLSLSEAAAWLAAKLGEPVTEEEIIRTAAERQLPVCFHFRGQVWRDDESHHYFDGLLQSCHPPRLNTEIEWMQFRKGTGVTSRVSCEHTLQVRTATPVGVFLCDPPFPNEDPSPTIGLGASVRRLHPGRSVPRADWLFCAKKLLATLTQDQWVSPTASLEQPSQSEPPIEALADSMPDRVGQAMAAALKVKRKSGRKPGVAPVRLVEILDALEKFAISEGEPFDRKNMPGPLGENCSDVGSFHWLCATIDPAFKRAKTTFAKHRAGLCALGSWAAPTDFYRHALPYIQPKLCVVQEATGQLRHSKKRP